MRKTYSEGCLKYLHAKWDLEEARWAYWAGDNYKAYKLLMRAIDALVIEPHPDSEEYLDGERKSATPDDEQTEEEGFPLEAIYPSEGSIDGPTPERDEDGYLIR